MWESDAALWRVAIPEYGITVWFANDRLVSLFQLHCYWILNLRGSLIMKEACILDCDLPATVDQGQSFAAHYQHAICCQAPSITCKYPPTFGETMPRFYCEYSRNPWWPLCSHMRLTQSSGMTPAMEWLIITRWASFCLFCFRMRLRVLLYLSRPRKCKPTTSKIMSFSQEFKIFVSTIDGSKGLPRCDWKNICVTCPIVTNHREGGVDS